MPIDTLGEVAFAAVEVVVDAAIGETQPKKRHWFWRLLNWTLVLLALGFLAFMAYLALR